MLQAFLITTCLICALVFHFYGDIDLYIAGIFYDNGFIFEKLFFPMLVHRAAPYIVLCFGLWMIYRKIKIFLATRSFNPKHYLVVLYVLVSLLLGPVIVVNAVCKENFGRARPRQIQEFGGNSKFTEAFKISDECKHNCSFVSGHASIGFAVYAFAFLHVGRKRNMWLIFGTLAGSIMGLGRIMAGAHFLSDVIFSGVFVYLSCYATSKAFSYFGVNLPEENQKN